MHLKPYDGFVLGRVLNGHRWLQYSRAGETRTEQLRRLQRGPLIAVRIAGRRKHGQESFVDYRKAGS